MRLRDLILLFPFGSMTRCNQTQRKHVHLVQQRGTVYANVQSQNCMRCYFFCLNLGCQHAHGKPYLATECLNFSIIDETCDNSCFICTQKWHDQFRPVYRSSVVAFLEYLMQLGKLPQDIDYKAPISLLLVGSKFWKEAIFDRAAGDIS
jgi:hypothetical protein